MNRVIHTYHGPLFAIHSTNVYRDVFPDPTLEHSRSSFALANGTSLALDPRACHRSQATAKVVFAWSAKHECEVELGRLYAHLVVLSNQDHCANLESLSMLSRCSVILAL